MADPLKSRLFSSFRGNEMWAYFGPAFVASVAYIDPGNLATKILGGSQFGYRLLWVLLWSNLMAILIQYLSAKLGIVTGLTLPQNCRKHFARSTTILLWIAAESCTPPCRSYSTGDTAAAASFCSMLVTDAGATHSRSASALMVTRDSAGPPSEKMAFR